MLGSQHPDTLRSINQLGLLLQEQGELGEAESLALEYEHGVQCLWGTKHPDNMVAITNRGQLRLNQGQLAEAEMLYQRAADEASRIFGADHPKRLPPFRTMRVLARRSAGARRLRKGSQDHQGSRSKAAKYENRRFNV